MISLDDISAVTLATAYAPTGERIGRVGDVYIDDVSGQPAWVTIAAGLFGSRTLFAPLAGADLEGDRLVLAHGKDVVEAAPSVADSGHISDVEQQQLVDYYGAVDAAADADGWAREAAVDAGAPEPADEVDEFVADDPEPAAPAGGAEAPAEDDDFAADDVSEPEGEAAEPDRDADARLATGLGAASALLAGAGAAAAGPVPEDEFLDAGAPEPLAAAVEAGELAEPAVAHSADDEEEPAGALSDEIEAEARQDEQLALAEEAGLDTGLIGEPVVVPSAEELGAEDARPEVADDSRPVAGLEHAPLSGPATVLTMGNPAAQADLSGQFRMHPGYTRETIYRDAAGHIVYTVLHTFDDLFGPAEG